MAKKPTSRKTSTSSKRRKPPTLYQVITEATNFYLENGFTSQTALTEWSRKLALAARRDSPDNDAATKHLETIYKRLVIGKGVTRYVPADGPGAFTVDKLKPRFRAELERRIFLSANLIKLNREQAIEKTLQRFQGWATSIPPGGSPPIDKVKRKEQMTKAIPKLSYEARRVAIDQGHKLSANIQYVFAMQGSPVAFRWHSNWRRPGYNYRVDHKERDELYYIVRDSQEYQDGYIKPVNGFYDEITAAAEEPFCSCRVVPIYSPRRLPDEYLTKKGLERYKGVKPD